MSPRRRARALLVRGDTVGVVASGFALRPALLESGVRALRRMGFAVRLGDHVLSHHGYLAGDDEARADDFRTMLQDPEIRAIWFARGGYGTARILDRLPWRELQRNPKPLIGYSDMTSLFCPMVRRTDAICLYGPVVVELGNATTYHRPSLRRMLAGEPATLRFLRRQVMVEGRARGRLVGGNLTVMAHLWGTRFAPDLRNAVLILEDVGEECYRIDRALTQLRLAGAFRGLVAVLLGNFSVPPRTNPFPSDRPFGEVLAEAFEPLGVPVVRDLPIGHLAGKWTVPLGGVAEIDTTKRQVRFVP